MMKASRFTQEESLELDSLPFIEDVIDEVTVGT